MEHDHLMTMLNRLKLTAIRDQLDSLVDEAGRRELTIREALSLFCEREIARKDERRIEMSVKLARFSFVRDLDGFDFAAQPSLDKKQIRAIARIQTEYLSRRLAERQLKLTLTEKALDLLGNVGFDPVYGARPLKRAIQQQLENPLAREILEGKFQPGDTVAVDAAGGQLVFARHRG